MAQFDICQYITPEQSLVHYVVILDHEFADLDVQKVVAPCYRATDYGPPISRLNLEINIKGTPYIIAMQELTSTARRRIGSVAGSAIPLEDGIRRALDFVFSGF